MVARVVTALCHGAFFGIGSVVAANLVAPDRRARAVALMFTGLTLANVLGVPLGTAIGQAFGWRSTFAVVTVIGIVTIAGLIAVLPRDKQEEQGNIFREIAALKNGHLWLALSTTVFFSASMFALFTYIAPLLRDVTGLSPEGRDLDAVPDRPRPHRRQSPRRQACRLEARRRHSPVFSH
jgi:DHA1 family inner membrane transport protein